MSNKILLIYPGKYGTFKPELPLSLLYLSSILKGNGYQCQILDMRLEHFKDCDLKNTLCVGITSMTGLMIKYGLEFAKFVREINSKIPIVWGGVHPSLVPEETVTSSCVDVVVRGEGEETFLELVQAIENNTALHNIKGITFKKNGRIISTPDRDFIDLDAIPIELSYDLIKLERYDLSLFPIHTSRGCPHSCSFCYNLAYNKRIFRCKNPERVLDEVDWVLKKFSVKTISFFCEDNFFVDRNRIAKICEGILKRGLNFKWGAFCHFDYAAKYDDAFFQLIEKSGCSCLSFGGESGSQVILDSIFHKGIKIEQILETTKKMARTKITQIISFICGIPTESYNDFLKTCALIDQILQINPKTVINGIFLYTPYPGTSLIKTLKENYHFLAPQTLEQWQEYRIYRDVGGNWLDKSYKRIFRGISIMTRFPFYKNNPQVPERFSKFGYRQLYQFLSCMSQLRWKHRFFKFPIEWLLLEKAMEKWRGYV